MASRRGSTSSSPQANDDDVNDGANNNHDSIVISDEIRTSPNRSVIGAPIHTPGHMWVRAHLVRTAPYEDAAGSGVRAVIRMEVTARCARLPADDGSGAAGGMTASSPGAARLACVRVAEFILDQEPHRWSRLPTIDEMTEILTAATRDANGFGTAALDDTTVLSNMESFLKNFSGLSHDSYLEVDSEFSAEVVPRPGQATEEEMDRVIQNSAQECRIRKKENRLNNDEHLSQEDYDACPAWRELDWRTLESTWSRNVAAERDAVFLVECCASDVYGVHPFVLYVDRSGYFFAIDMMQCGAAGPHDARITRALVLTFSSSTVFHDYEDDGDDSDDGIEASTSWILSGLGADKGARDSAAACKRYIQDFLVRPLARRRLHDRRLTNKSMSLDTLVRDRTVTFYKLRLFDTEARAASKRALRMIPPLRPPSGPFRMVIPNKRRRSSSPA